MLDAVPFPIVTLCNFNRVKWSKAKQLNMDEMDLTIWMKHFPVTYFMDVPPGINLGEDGKGDEKMIIRKLEGFTAALQQYKDWKKRYDLNTTTILRRLAHSCSDIVWKVGVNHMFVL